ncbi:MAG TPA: DsbA family oxidoreductase [Chryseosolibacter sp.]|nr:DsbA family oxidoreductase [Chryseosolibacter sp.]
MMEKPLINIGIVSDVVCPWCYIGKRRLEQAMAFASDRFDFELEYLPFELNPHLPEEGIDNQEYLCKKFGSKSKFEQVIAHVKHVAAREGLEFNFEKQQTYPNTRNAHRIILMARETGKQNDVIEALFRAYFTNGVDLSNKENLIGIAAGAGLDRERVTLLMEGNTGKTQIEMAEKELHVLGINSVPLFIINNKTAISGAQSVETFTRAFDEMALVTNEMQRYARL